MAGGYPCCCSASSSGGGNRYCHCCVGYITPETWTVTVEGIANGTCADCEDLNGTYVLDWVRAGPFNASCVWELSIPETCGYDLVIFSIGGSGCVDVILGFYDSSFVVTPLLFGFLRSEINGFACSGCHESEPVAFGQNPTLLCGTSAATVTISTDGADCGDPGACCGDDFSMDLIADITGADLCACSCGPALDPHNLRFVYFGTGAFDVTDGGGCACPTTDANAGPMKWYVPEVYGGSILLIASCTDPTISIRLYVTCCCGGAAWQVQYSGSIPTGSCNFDGVVLSYAATNCGAAPAGCPAGGSTVTLSVPA